MNPSIRKILESMGLEYFDDFIVDYLDGHVYVNDLNGLGRNMGLNWEAHEKEVIWKGFVFRGRG